MRSVRKSIKVLLWTFVAMFVTLSAYLGYTVTVNGARWFISPHNPRLGQQQQNVIAGSILDRNHVVLAKSTQPGERQYHPDEIMRKATSHTVGDPSGVAATGVESFHAQYLLGFNVNVFERLYQGIVMQKRVGDSVVLTLDSALTDYAYRKLGSNAGAIVVMNWQTGEILCSTSAPAYDPANMEQYQNGANSLESNLVNRVTMGRYTPGSVFKTVTLSAVVKYRPDLLQKTYSCAGHYEVGEGVITCAGNARHGEQTVQKAYDNSCNIAFAQMARDLGRELLIKMAQEYGFNQEFLFEDFVIFQSKYTAGDRDLDFAWSSIGQYLDLATPLEICMVAATVANGGVMMEPQLVKSIVNARNYEKDKLHSKILKRALESDMAQMVKDAMISVVKEGTGKSGAISGLTVGGKTGSAEVSDDKTQKTHAWFHGFIDSDKSPLAIAVIIEQGGSGGSVAAPIARDVLKKAVALGY